jgi:hypothetical protein
MDICIYDPITLEWTSSVRKIRPAMRDTYAQYKERSNYYRETPYSNGEYIVYRPGNDPYFPTYIARVADVQSIHERMENDGRAIPIIDLADISVFISDPSVVGSGRANWFPARAYQAWAYRDFVYDRHRSIKKSYVSRNTPENTYISDDRVLANQIVTLPHANIDTNIIFSIGRNENGSVYIERNDALGSHSRICDNEYARAGYFGYYTRVTMDPGIIVTEFDRSALLIIPSGGSGSGYTSTNLSTSHISAPEETDDERQQCILCVRFRVNARLLPCEHRVCCSVCYSQLAKNECPVCRAEITQLINV